MQKKKKIKCEKIFSIYHLFIVLDTDTYFCIYFYPIFIQIFLLVSNIVLTLLCFRFPSGLAMAIELVRVDIFVMFEAVLKNGNALDIIIS